MVAFQLVGKATREALFLGAFEVTDLPRMTIAAAVVSALTVLALSRLLLRAGPTRLVPRLFVASAALLVAEWLLMPRAPRTVVVAYYLHFSALGALLVSGFWAMVAERFDPRAARASFARITTGASLGGLLGGLLTLPLGARVPVAALLPVLAGLHAATALLLRGLHLADPAAVGSRAPRSTEALEVFQGSRYLRLLVSLVILTAMAEGLLDWVFKARALAVAPSAGELLRFFTLFYCATALLGLLLQAVLLPALLARLGSARSAALLPAGVLLGSAMGLVLPGLSPLLGARATEAVLRGGIFRSAYELLFTPVLPAERRATKLLVDVGASRLGDLAGAACVQMLLLGAGNAVGGSVLVATILVAAGALAVARQLHRGYAGALARNLTVRSGGLDPVMEETGGLLQTLTELRAAPSGPVPDPPPSAPRDSLPLDRATALASPDRETVRAALRQGPLPAALIGRVVTLLAWDAVAGEALEALAAQAEAVAPVLVDRLLDPDEEFAVRRRLVRVLAGVPTREVFTALHEALKDRRFEVRYLAGRALYRQKVARPELVVDDALVRDVVLTEVSVGQGIWEGRRLLDATDDADAPMETSLLRDRADRSLEHVFTLLALVLPEEPLRLAYHGLHTADRHLRGTALEYLERVLPPRVREQLWPYLEPEEAPGPPAGDAEGALARLLESRQSIILALEAANRRREAAE